MLRLFIGIETDEGIKDIASDFRAHAEPMLQSCRWVERDNIHLTLRFLGECRDSQITELEAALAAALRNESVFSAFTNGFGVFPSHRRARVLWLGVKNNTRFLGLYSVITEHLAALGFPPEERDYRPHITLARLRTSQKIPAGLLKRGPDLAHEFEVKAVTLFSSVLTVNGPKYEVIKRVELAP